MPKGQDSDVKTAFELLAITLDEEQDRIFKAGAKAMEQKNVNVAQVCNCKVPHTRRNHHRRAGHSLPCSHTPWNQTNHHQVS